MTLFYRWENKRRDKVEGGRPPKGEFINVVEEHDLAIGEFNLSRGRRSEVAHAANDLQVSDMFPDCWRERSPAGRCGGLFSADTEGSIREYVRLCNKTSHILGGGLSLWLHL